jgi:hypothetical protein
VLTLAQKLYQLPVYSIGFAIFVILCLVALAGFKVGRHRARNLGEQDSKDQEIGGVVLGGMLGMLGLVLAFTYGFNLTRYETRRSAVVAEANDAGTVFLRASLLPSAERREMQQAILRYTRTRLFHLGARDSQELELAVKESLETQEVLWPLAMKLSEGRLGGPERTFLLGAMNNLLDSHTSRVAVATQRMPMPVLFFGLGLAMASIFLTGYNARRQSVPPFILLGSYAFIVAGAFALIIDFDQAGVGLLLSDDSSLRATIEDMERILGTGQ